MCGLNLCWLACNGHTCVPTPFGGGKEATVVIVGCHGILLDGNSVGNTGLWGMRAGCKKGTAWCDTCRGGTPASNLGRWRALCRSAVWSRPPAKHKYIPVEGTLRYSCTRVAMGCMHIVACKTCICLSSSFKRHSPPLPTVWERTLHTHACGTHLCGISSALCHAPQTRKGVCVCGREAFACVVQACPCSPLQPSDMKTAL